jgi:hypothetical protein
MEIEIDIYKRTKKNGLKVLMESVNGGVITGFKNDNEINAVLNELYALTEFLESLPYKSLEFKCDGCTGCDPQCNEVIQ